ncbi:MAG: CHASE2 domain-containing protein, partial [Candidatus Omnitrophota bacterium]
MAGLFLSFSYNRVFDEFENSTLDLRYRIRPHQNVGKDIVIVEIGDDSISKLGKWPFPRNYHALLVQALKSAGVKTILFDIFFSESKEEDDSFAESVKNAGNVYMPYVFELDRSNPDKTRMHAAKITAPLIDVLSAAAKGTGFVNVEPDFDGKVRRIPLFIEYYGDMYPQVTVKAALNDLGYDFSSEMIFPGKKMKVGDDIIIPLGEDSTMLVNYPDVWGKAFRHYSYVDIIQSYLADVMGQEPFLDLKDLEGSVCFVGFTATASPDAHPSPMERLYPGVGVHTSVYNSIINRSFIKRLNKWWNLFILVAMWMITAYVTLK